MLQSVLAIHCSPKYYSRLPVFDQATQIFELPSFTTPQVLHEAAIGNAPVCNLYFCSASLWLSLFYLEDLTYMFSFFFFILAVLGFCCCMQAFSSCGERGLLFLAVARDSHCGGFSCCGAWALGAWASVAAAHGLSSCGVRASVVVVHVLSCSVAHGIFPDQG